MMIGFVTFYINGDQYNNEMYDFVGSKIIFNWVEKISFKLRRIEI